MLDSLNILKQLARQLHLKPTHSFTGGVHPEALKRTAGMPSMTCPLPKQVILPVKQHIGDACEPVVQVGDRVLRGQIVAKAQGYVSVPVHASTSGTVVAIEEHVIAHPSGLGMLCVFIEPDGKDEADESLTPLPNYRSEDPVLLRERIRLAGLSGLGGAAFPTFIKLVLDKQHPIKTVILNGVECEPWLTCDHQLMLEKAHDIITGMDILMYMVGAEEGVIAIEDNKPDAVQVMQQTLEEMGFADAMRIEVLPTKYPQGGEKQLIQALTGKEVPAGRLPIHIGVLSQNVGTSKAIYDAVCLGEALVERMITVSGDALPQPANMRVRLGTPVDWLLEHAGLSQYDDIKVIHGGSMMGELLPDVSVPVVKASNGILAMRKQTVMSAHHQEEPCIRCGDCGDACPAGLMPNLLAWHCKEERFDKAEDYNLFDCIECGACSYVCPAHIPLVHYFRYGKGQVAQIRREKAFAEASRLRSEKREARIAREKAEKEEKRRLAKAKREAAAKAKAEQEAVNSESSKPEDSA